MGLNGEMRDGRGRRGWKRFKQWIDSELRWLSDAEIVKAQQEEIRHAFKTFHYGNQSLSHILSSTDDDKCIFSHLSSQMNQ